MARNLLTAQQTARRLGVKLPTVYAYVSRGVLGRTLSADGRTSRFDVTEVEALARRGRPRQESQRTGGVDVTLATAIAGIVDGRLYFRGYDATALARTSTFEDVAELLWTSALPDGARFPERDERARVARASVAALESSAGYLERLSVAVAAAATAYPLRVDLRPESVVEHARSLLSTYVLALEPPSRPPKGRRAPSRAFAARLLPCLSPVPIHPDRVALLDAALVLLADHELATSTLAARVAASTRADPFAVVLAGLGAVSGPLHGKAAVAAHRLILDAARSTPERALARVLESDGKVPGFGHPVYRGVDPRAAHLLERLDGIARPPFGERIRTLTRAGKESTGFDPNVDFALGAVAAALDMPVGATEAVFAIARTAGWIAHALEEYGETPLRFRARSIYTGVQR